MLSSLLYVSHSRIPEQVANSSVQKIVAAAEIRNRHLGVTGAVLFTGKHFAQIIEGDSAAIDMLWGDIGRDIRHEKLMVVERKSSIKRRFADWSMAFFGPSYFVTRHITGLAHERSEAHYLRTAKWLNELLEETCGRDAVEEARRVAGRGDTTQMAGGQRPIGLV